MRTSSRRMLVLGTLFGVLAGCGDDAGGEGSPGRGSAACQDWQDALCDFAADRCKAIDRAACDAQYRGVVCKSDEAATKCANDFNDLACGTADPSCDIRGIADPAPAKKACDDFLTLACKRQHECDATKDEAECKADLSGQLDCERAIAVELDYEACMDQVRSLSCAATGLPDICTGVIRALQ